MTPSTALPARQASDAITIGFVARDSQGRSLPNALHFAASIAVNTAFWAMNRAQWANAMLASLGVRS